MKLTDYHFQEKDKGEYIIENVRNKDIKFYSLYDFMDQKQNFTSKGIFQERLERHPDWQRINTKDASAVYVNSKYHTVKISGDITLDLQGDSFNSEAELREAEAFLRGDPQAFSIRQILTN